MANEERESEELEIETGLGEISEPKMLEQGEVLPDDFTYLPGNEMPADLQSATPLGGVSPILEDKTQGASVRSVFDTRLINSTDFNFAGSEEVTPSAELNESVSIGFIVPQSYVAILRKFKWIITPNLVGEAEVDLLMSIKVDGISQVGHTDLVSMHAPEDYWDTHILAPEGSTISINFNFRATYSEGITYTVFAHLYGNLILSKQLPLAFEVGNPEVSKSIPVPNQVNKPDLNAMRQTGQPIKQRMATQNRPTRSRPQPRKTTGFSQGKRGRATSRLNLGLKKR